MNGRLTLCEKLTRGLTSRVRIAVERFQRDSHGGEQLQSPNPGRQGALIRQAAGGVDSKWRGSLITLFEGFLNRRRVLSLDRQALVHDPGSLIYRSWSIRFSGSGGLRKVSCVVISPGESLVAQCLRYDDDRQVEMEDHAVVDTLSGG